MTNLHQFVQDLPGRFASSRRAAVGEVRAQPVHRPRVRRCRTVVLQHRVTLHDAGHARVGRRVKSWRLRTRDRPEHADQVAAIRRGRGLHWFETRLPPKRFERVAIEIIEVREVKPVRRSHTHGLDVGHLDQQHALLGNPAAQARQNRRRILHVLQRVIHRHGIEAAGRKRRVLDKACRDRNPKRLACVARVVFVRLQAGGVEAELPQHVDHLATARAGVEHAAAAGDMTHERAMTIQRAAAGPGDMTHRRRGVPLVIEPVLAGVVTSHLFLSRPRIRPDEPARAADRRAQRAPVAIAIAEHLDIRRAAQITGNRTLNHDWRPGRIAAAPILRGSSSASGRTWAAARARTFRPAADP